MFAFEIILIIFSLALILLSKKRWEKDPPAVFNVYKRPGKFYTIKVLLMYFILSLRKLVYRIKSKKSKEILAQSLERPQPLSQHEKAIDGVYFNGANKNGDYFVTGMARRKNFIDGFMYILVKDSNLGLLETPKLPSTFLQTHEKNDKFAAEGIEILPEIPMKRWKILYEGKMKRFDNKNKFVHVKIEGIFTSELPYFDFDHDIGPLSMAKAIATNTWSRDYFNNLKENHQKHYEQHGDVKLNVTIEGKQYTVVVNTLRDHSFGIKREWRNLHRYALHLFTAENGDRFNVATVSLPISFSHLNVGYVYSAKDKTYHPIETCDFQLYQHGEFGDPPLDYAFIFTAGGKRYDVQVNVEYSPYFYISKDCESKVIERLCRYEVNNLKGWGAAEWQYRNVKGN